MASSYTIYDQAADLGIHRVHSLVLGDPKKEARIAAKISGFKQRPALKKGDVRTEEREQEWERKMELERIARRNNLKTDGTGYDDEMSLTQKIAAWGTLKAENTIARPDGLGTGNAHRNGPNYRPIPTFEQCRTLFTRPARGNAPGSYTPANRKPLPATTGSVAAAWQAAAEGKPFQPFILGGNSGISSGRAQVRSPVRTSARKSIVGSPRPRSYSPVKEAVPNSGTYADQMARVRSKIQSEHAPPKPDGNTSPKKSPRKSAFLANHGLEGRRWSNKSPPPTSVGRSRYSPSKRNSNISWSGRLATASDPYFQSLPRSPVVRPHASRASRPSLSSEPPSALPSPPQSSLSVSESISPTDEVPNTPASITTAIALEIEEYLDLLDEVEEDRYSADPDRRKRDIEINERVNRSLAEAEEAALAREILSPKSATERKTVQFAKSPMFVQSQLGISEDDEGEDEVEVDMRSVHVWNSFRDFVTVRSVTGFEDYVPEPRSLREEKRRLAGSLKSAKENTERDDKGSQMPTRQGATEIKIEGIIVTDAPKAEAPVTRTEAVLSVPPAPIVLPAPPRFAAITPPKPEDALALQESVPQPVQNAPQAPHQKQPIIPPPAVSSPATTPATISALNSSMSAPALEIEQSNKPSAPIMTVRKSPCEIGQFKLATSIRPDVPRPRNKLSPVNILRDVEPAAVESTWDMPITPLVEVDMDSKVDDRGGDAGNDAFLMGLMDSKKAEEKSEGKKCVIIEEPKKADIAEEPKLSIPSTVGNPITAAINTPSTVMFVPSFAPAADSASIKSRPRPLIFASVAKPPTQKNTISFPPVSSTLRSGMPFPVPTPPIPRPAIKSPTKQTIMPNPAKYIISEKSVMKVDPVADELSNPFLIALKATAKKEVPQASSPIRPKTPAESTDSAESTPKKPDSPSTTAENSSHDTSLTTSESLISAPPSPPTSLSSSWTFIEKAKKGVMTSGPGLPPVISTQVTRRTWFGSDSQPTPTTPTPTPTPTPVIPTTRPATTNDALSKPNSSYQPNRKLFTFELKIGNSIVSIPVHELDDPRIVADRFAKDHNLEKRLPGGKATVEKIINYFEAQFTERKSEREKRRAERRQKVRNTSSADQQKM